MQLMTRRLFQFLFLWLITLCSSEETSCTTDEALAGYAALTAFSSCSGLTSDDVTSMVELFEGEGSLDSSLKGAAEECSTLATSAEKQLCLAEFMNTLAANSMFTSEETDSNDDGSSQDILTTCGCLTTALETMPDCGVFSPFLELQNLLPIEQGVCVDLTDVCTSISLLSTACVPKDGTYAYDSASCTDVLEESDECGDSAELFWAAEVEGSEYCGFAQWKMKRLEDFYDSCPHSFSSTDTAADDDAESTITWDTINPVATGERIVRLVAAVLFSGGLVYTCYMYMRHRRTGGMLTRSEYSPLGNNGDGSEDKPPGFDPLFELDTDPL